MNVIVEGKYVFAKLVCSRCDCIFSVEPNEVEDRSGDGRLVQIYAVKCPCCGKTINFTEHAFQRMETYD